MAREVPPTIEGAFPNELTVALFKRWRLHQTDLFLDYETWWRHVIEPCVYFDALSFTVNAERLAKCRHLVCGKYPQGTLPPGVAVRIATNLHAKLYITYGPGGGVWMGSGNLVDSTGWHNPMVRVNAVNSCTLRRYFDRLWAKSTPLPQLAQMRAGGAALRSKGLSDPPLNGHTTQTL